MKPMSKQSIYKSMTKSENTGLILRTHSVMLKLS